MSTPRTPEFLKASELLLPIIKGIPKDAIRRHSLHFEVIIKEMIDLTNSMKLEYPNAAIVHYMQATWQKQLQLNLADNLPFYTTYGKSRKQSEPIKAGELQ